MGHNMVYLNKYFSALEKKVYVFCHWIECSINNTLSSWFIRLFKSQYHYWFFYTLILLFDCLKEGNWNLQHQSSLLYLYWFPLYWLFYYRERSTKIFNFNNFIYFSLQFYQFCFMNLEDLLSEAKNFRTVMFIQWKNSLSPTNSFGSGIYFITIPASLCLVLA